MNVIDTMRDATNAQVITIGRLYRNFSSVAGQNQERQISDNVGNRRNRIGARERRTEPRGNRGRLSHPKFAFDCVTRDHGIVDE